MNEEKMKTVLVCDDDDYVTKPFNPLELVARVKSQIRRYVSLGSMEIKESQLVTGGIVLDTDTKQVTVDGDEAKLTPILRIRYLNILCAIWAGCCPPPRFTRQYGTRRPTQAKKQ